MNAMLIISGLPQNMWGEAILSIVSPRIPLVEILMMTNLSYLGGLNLSLKPIV